MNESPKVGSVVIFTDENRRDHNALVTAVWSPTCINLMRVSADESKTDVYGRQLERNTSVTRYTPNQPGMCWRLPGESAEFTDQPQQS